MKNTTNAAIGISAPSNLGHVCPISVGSTVWVFDHNRRKYDSQRRIIYREYWVPVQITGENLRSWVTYYGKFPKKADERGRYYIPQGGYSPLRVALDPAEVEEDIWLSDHAHKILEAVRCCDASTLRKIAELIGYDSGEVIR